MLPFQDLATWVCLTGPFPNYTLGQEEAGRGRIKRGQSGPHKWSNLPFYDKFFSYALEYDHLYFCIIPILCSLELCKMAGLLFFNCWCTPKINHKCSIQAQCWPFLTLARLLGGPEGLQLHRLIQVKVNKHFHCKLGASKVSRTRLVSPMRTMSVLGGQSGATKITWTSSWPIVCSRLSRGLIGGKA